MSKPSRKDVYRAIEKNEVVADTEELAGYLGCDRTDVEPRVKALYDDGQIQAKHGSEPG